MFKSVEGEGKGEIEGRKKGCSGGKGERMEGWWWRREGGAEERGRVGGSELVGKLAAGWVRDPLSGLASWVRERYGFVGMKKKKKKEQKKEMRDLINICTKFLVRKSDLSLLRTCSDKIGFIVDNVTKNTTSISATTSFRRYFSHSTMKLVSSQIV